MYCLYCLLQDEVAAMQPKLQESHVETTQIMKQLQQVCVCGCGWGGREGEEEGAGHRGLGHRVSAFHAMLF